MSNWAEVNRSNPCPICNGTSWCSLADSGNVVKCMRVPDGAFKSTDDASGVANFHRLTGEEQARVCTIVKDMTKREKLSRSLPELESIYDSSQCTTERIYPLSAELGVSVPVLRQLQVGWLSKKALMGLNTKCNTTGVYTFPMRDRAGALCGFRLRINGFKYALSGSNNGFFIPHGLKKNMHLAVVEGPTDTAAALAYNLHPIGRPNNNAMARELGALVGAYKPKAVDIIIDRDPVNSRAAHSTYRGALFLVEMLSVYANRIPVRIARPVNHKDIRVMFNKNVPLKGGLEIV